MAGKTNVLIYVQDLWYRTFMEVAKEYPDITPDYAHIDATTMWMVKNPEWFDVIVTENMFGDIITDLGAIIQGGMGVAAGGTSTRREYRCSSPSGALLPSTQVRTSSTPWLPSWPEP